MLAHMSTPPRPPPPPIEWEDETVHDVPPILPILIGTIGICLAIITILLLITMEPVSGMA
jgi:hypothetical protein